MKSCKCTVELGQYDDRATIVFCPLHSAAEELRNTLQLLVDTIDPPMKYKKKNDLPLEPYFVLPVQRARELIKASQPAKDK